jgi:hypothetical protein
MRLTLRTLLAYLDNTLDAQDAEALKSKLAESGFATQMVQRIRSLLTQPDLPAPSPLARGPVEDANVICEYLDSTLPVEQVAEVERVCLDSDPHLAEAAACHQILTMVLENPASVPVVLRDRIYQLPGEQKGPESTTGSFSALAIPEPVDSFDAPSNQDLSSEMPPAPPQQPVRPVGVGDSGVMDAPARLRQRELADNQAARKEPAIAGVRPVNPQSDSTVYGGQIRSSRIMPWLVTLGLTAVLLYALSQIFQPLIDLGKTADSNNATQQGSSSNNQDSGAGVDGEVNAEEVDPEQQTEGEGQAPDADVGVSNDSDLGGSEGDKESTETPDAEAGPPRSSNDDAANRSDVDADKPEMQQADDAGDSTASTKPIEPASSDPSPVITPTPVPQPPEAGKPASEEMEQESPDVNDSRSPSFAKVISENTLLAGKTGDQWQRLEKDAEVAAQQPLVVAKITLVGAASAMLLSDKADGLAVRLTSGKMLVSALNPESAEETEPAEEAEPAKETEPVVQIQLGDEECTLRLSGPDTVVAVEVAHTRGPGLDPVLPENRVAVRRLIAINGSVTVDVGGVSVVIEANNQWTQVGESEPSLKPLDVLPDWATKTVSDADVLALTARENLLALLDDAASLEIGLRELLGFRRSEVADLAARTLLGLGKSDVYFGGAGVLSDPTQRAYWPQHYDALLSRVNSDAEAALEVQEAIEKMDAAAEVQLFRMLTGYTDEQLASGSDLQLLENLDSSNMSVRVLAFENLRRITGVTFNYRAEQDSKARREQYMKKWRVRQRKGEIRWKD